jgi:hypothetical protein
MAPNASRPAGLHADSTVHHTLLRVHELVGCACAVLPAACAGGCSSALLAPLVLPLSAAPVGRGADGVDAMA